MGEGQEEGDKLSRQTRLGDGDYGSLMLQRICPFSCPNWAILGKKKKTFVILLYLKLQGFSSGNVPS